MITGMTGFGSAQFSVGKTKGIIEIKSVNHRYYDVAYFLPPGFGVLENKIGKVVEKSLSRGRITVAVKVTQKPSQTFSFNREVVEQYINVSNELKRKYHLQNQLSVSDLLRAPGVVEIKETVITPEELWPAIEKSLRKAVDSVLSMRKKEGKTLASDIGDQLKLMREEINKIKSRSKLILQEKKKLLNEEEYASFQRSEDINEELARLIHYIDEAKLLIKSGTLVGKKMDFIAQEMQRETNTVGSKIQDKTVSNAVIALKSKIEKIREQSQNVE